MPTRSNQTRRRPAPPRRRGPRLGVALVFACLAALPFGALAWADHDHAGQIPPGYRIAGVDVGGLAPHDALVKLRAAVGIPAARAVRVTIDGDTSSTLTARRAGVHLNLRAAVRRAVRAGERGSFVSRGWRALTGARLARRENLRVHVNRAAVQRFVSGLAAEVSQPAQSPALAIAVDSVSASPAHDGRALAGQAQLTDRLVRALRARTGPAALSASTVTVTPAAADPWAAHPTVVTVSHGQRLVRVFDRGQLVKTYTVAVGQPAYPTPDGTFSVQTMQKNPAWNVPNSSWAGDLAGKTIPGGDPSNPLKARFIGFDGSVGFHGTAELDSLGKAESHGCVRMRPADVKDLFTRVTLGTTVYVGA